MNKNNVAEKSNAIIRVNNCMKHIISVDEKSLTYGRLPTFVF
nr:MAG TPA: hypothetical protein [Ackermannviridae sp.]